MIGTHPARVTAAAVIAALLALGGITAVTAQDAGTSATDVGVPVSRPAELTMTTDYPAVIAAAGEDARFPLTVSGPVDEPVSLRVEGAPDGYDTTLRGGESIVSSVFVQQDPPPLELSVRVPDDAQPGTQAITITAVSDSDEVDLPLEVTVSEVPAGAVTLTSKYPVLSGESDASYSFDLTLRNETNRDATLGLSAEGPDGWRVDVRPSGAAKASTALVTAGGRTNVKVTADAPLFTPAGQYPIRVVAEGDGHLVEAQLGVEITGSFDMDMATPDGRLNTSTAPGDEADVKLVLTNTGTAPLTQVKLTASTPKGWEVSYEPETVDAIAPLASTEVVARVTPAGNAVAGDYVVTMRARNDKVNDKLELRTTVETPPMWGAAAIGVIAVALGGLALVFRRYGRR